MATAWDLSGGESSNADDLSRRQQRTNHAKQQFGGAKPANTAKVYRVRHLDANWAPARENGALTKVMATIVLKLSQQAAYCIQTGKNRQVLIMLVSCVQ